MKQLYSFVGSVALGIAAILLLISGLWIFLVAFGVIYGIGKGVAWLIANPDKIDWRI